MVSAGLTARLSPSTGLYKSLTALTDSISPNGFAGLHAAARLRQLDVHQVGQGFDGEGGNADRRRLRAAGPAIEVDPLVRAGVLKGFRIERHWLGSFQVRQAFQPDFVRFKVRQAF